MPTVSVQELLSGTYYGRRQSVGNMEVVPIIGENDENYSPPDVRVSTNNYGSVQARNLSDRPTIVPLGSGWVVDAKVQDHAVGSGALVPAKSTATIKAFCIQESQPGLIRATDEKTFVVLPLPLRLHALSARSVGPYNALWSSISRYRSACGFGGRGNLAEYLDAVSTDLDRFVAHFECHPKQIGAIILVNRKIVGVELTPSSAFWAVLWEPLIRVCYGSYALLSQGEMVKKRKPLPEAKSISALAAALRGAELQWALETHDLMDELCERKLETTGEKEHGLYTGASKAFAGQFLKNGENSRTSYMSLVSNSIRTGV